MGGQRCGRLLYRRYLTCIVMSMVMVAAVACSSGHSPARKPGPPILNFTSATAATVGMGAAASLKISVTDPKATITEKGTLPNGLEFEGGAGGNAMISGVPQYGTGGRYAMSLIARDATRYVDQDYAVTVDQQPGFVKGDPREIVLATGSQIQYPFLTTGFPRPTVSLSGELQHGMVFKSIPGGAATISGSPGYLETPCVSDVTLTATNSAGSATLPVAVHLKNLRCAFFATLFHLLLHNALSIGQFVVRNGKSIGQWIVRSGKNIGKFVSRSGKTVAENPEDLPDE